MPSRPVGEKKAIGKDNQPQKKPQPAPEQARAEIGPAEALAQQAGMRLALPDNPFSQPLRQAQLLQLQRTHGNAFVQRLLAQQVKQNGARPAEPTDVRPLASSDQPSLALPGSLAGEEVARVSHPPSQLPLAGQPVVQRQHQKKKEIPAGKNLVVQDDGTITLRVSWIKEHAKEGLNKTEIYAPEVLKQVLLNWLDFGVLGWIDKKEINAAAEKLHLVGPIDPANETYTVSTFDPGILRWFSLPAKVPDIQTLVSGPTGSLILLIRGGLFPDTTKKFDSLISKIITTIKANTGLEVGDENELRKQVYKDIPAHWTKSDKTLVVQISRGICDYLFGFTLSSKGTKTNWEIFRGKLKGSSKVTLVGEKGAKGKGAKGGGAKGRKPPEWASKLQTEVRSLIKQTREKDPKTEYLPDEFHLHFSESRDAWRGAAVIRGLGDQKDTWVSVSISEKSVPSEVLHNLQIKLRAVSTEQELQEIKKPQSELDDKHLWAEEKRQALWKLVVDERKGWDHPQLNLPDALGLYVKPLEGGEAKIFLVVTVRAEEEGEGGEKTPVIRQATMPEPLEKTTDVNELFPEVKALAYALRKGPTEESKKEKIEPRKRMQQAFSAHIIAKEMREDNITVTNGEHEFIMALEYQHWYRDQVAQFGEAWATKYYRWSIFRVDDSFEPPAKGPESGAGKEEEKAPPEKPAEAKAGQEADETPAAWAQRRARLQQHFENQKEKLAEENAAVAGVKRTWRQSRTPVLADIMLDIPSKEGTYIIHSSAQVKPSDTRYVEPSYAVYVIKAVDGYKLAAAETKKKRRHEELSLYESTKKDLAATERAHFLLTELSKYLRLRDKTKQPLSKLLAEDKNAKDIMEMWAQLELTPPVGGDLQAKIERSLKELKEAKKSLDLLSGRIGRYKNDFKPGTQIYTPVATLASEVTGHTHPFLLMLGEAKDSSIDTVKYILVDMSNPKKSKKYEGEGGNKGAAIRAAFEDFAKNNDYGEGYVAYRVPGVMDIQKVRNKPGIRKRVLNALKAIALVGGIIALAFGAVATGGTSLALLATVLGVAAGVSGAIVAAESIRERSENYRLDYDAEFFLDVLNVVGGAVALLRVAGAATKAAKVTKVLKGPTTAEQAAAAAKWAERIYKVEKGFLIHSGADVVGNAVFTPLKIMEDLKAIEESDLPEEVKESMKQEVIVNGIVSGFMISFSAYQFKGELAQVRTSKLEAQALANRAKYEALLQKAGLADENGALIAPKPPEAETPGKVPPETPAPETGKAKPGEEPSPPVPATGKEPPKTPKPPVPEEGGGPGGLPPPEPKPKAWDDPSLTENELIRMEFDKQQPPKSWTAEQKKQWAIERKDFLRSQYRKGLRFDPKTKRWVTLFGKGKIRTENQLINLGSQRRARLARTYARKNEQALLRGDAKALQGLLDVHGNWKELVISLRAGDKTQRAIAEQLGSYRQKIVQELIGSRGGEKYVRTLEGATTRPESDVDLNFYGQKAGERMLNAEAQMKAMYGPNWREKLRMNFYTEPGRLTRFGEAAAKLPKEQRARIDAEITALAERYNFAKMLQHAGKDKLAVERIKKLMQAAGVDMADVKPLLKMGAKQREQRRQELHKEIDALERAYSNVNGEDKLKLAEQITKKQMEANFLTAEAYIGPGAVRPKPGTTQDAFQNMLSQLEMMEKEIASADGDIVKAMREYEIYKYMHRFSEANQNKQLDLLYDLLPKQISKINREGAKSFTDDQIRSLYRDFMNYAYNALKGKRLSLLTEAGGKFGGTEKSWNAPDLTADEMIKLYRAAKVTSKTKLSDQDLKKMYEDGWRFDDETRRWRKPFKAGKDGGTTKELSFESIKDLPPVAEDSKVPATQLGLDQSRLDKFKDSLDAESVARIKQKSTLDQVKAQLAEEVSNKLGLKEAAGTEAKQGGQVSFFRGDKISGPAPTGTHEGAAHALLTDGMVAEITWKNGEAELYIHQIYEVKAGHASATELHKQAEWDIERIKELGLSLKITKPDGSQGWHFFPPAKIKMPPRSQQKELVSGFVPADVKPPKTTEATRQYTLKNLPGIESEDLHLAALMILRHLGKGVTAPEQLPLPLTE